MIAKELHLRCATQPRHVSLESTERANMCILDLEERVRLAMWSDPVAVECSIVLVNERTFTHSYYASASNKGQNHVKK
jgi:hypothetical protein